MGLLFWFAKFQRGMPALALFCLFSICVVWMASQFRCHQYRCILSFVFATRILLGSQFLRLLLVLLLPTSPMVVSASSLIVSEMLLFL